MTKTVAGSVKNEKTTHSSSVTVSTIIPLAMAQDIDIALVQTLPTVTPELPYCHTFGKLVDISFALLRGSL